MRFSGRDNVMLALSAAYVILATIVVVFFLARTTRPTNRGLVAHASPEAGPGDIVGTIGATGSLQTDSNTWRVVGEDGRALELGTIGKTAQIVYRLPGAPNDGVPLTLDVLKRDFIGKAVTVVAEVHYNKHATSEFKPAFTVRLEVFLHLDGLPKAKTE